MHAFRDVDSHEVQAAEGMYKVYEEALAISSSVSPFLLSALFCLSRMI